MKNMKRFAAILVALFLLAVSVSPALAASAYAPLVGTTYTITEHLYLEHSDTIVPEVTYKLELVNTTPTTQAGGQVPAGAVTGTPSITTDTVAFDASSTVHGHGSNYGRYVTGDFVIDFTHVTFYEPGIYRYNLTKTMTTEVDDSKIKNNRASDYIDVYVANDDSTNTLKSALYVHDDKDETVNTHAIGKAYMDRYRSTDRSLFITKTVKGNAASQSQYFEFTIKLSGGVPNAKYEIGGTYQNTTEITTSNTETKDNVTLLDVKAKTNTDPEGTPDKYIQLDANGAYEGKVWLRHNQGVNIKDLAEGIEYAVTEDSAGYEQSFKANTDAASGEIPTSTENDDADVTVAFVNTKTVATPTGINLHTAAPVFGIVLAGMLLAIVLISKRRENY